MRRLWEKDPKTGEHRPYTNVNLMVRLERALATLGLTPADRSRVSVDKSKTSGNAFAKKFGM
jgi:hypothetical protein